MGTTATYRTDLFHIFNYVQNTQIIHPKETFIETLREAFGKDSYYHYQADQWGFPKINDHTDLPRDAGLHDDKTSRIFIGEPFRFDLIQYPAILVRSAGQHYVPISMNREQGSVQWRDALFVDGYGNETIISVPDHFINAGAWEGSITVDVETRSPRSRDELIEIISILFTDTMHRSLQRSGVFIKGTSIGSPAESEDRNDAKLFRQTITFDIRSEWRRQIPISSVIEVISFCIDFYHVENKQDVIAPNLSISSKIDLINALANI